MADETIPSFNAQLRALKKGESLARTKRYQLGQADAAEITTALHAMRRTVNAIVSRIRETTGSNFRVESGSMLTNDNDAIHAVVTVSRI